MKNVLRVLVAVALVATLVSTIATVGLAAKVTTMPSRTAGGPAPIAISAEQVSAKVVGVSQSARTVTLQMSNGRIVTYKVPADVRNFNQIKRGDMVTATVLDALAVYVQKSGGRSTATETQTVTLAPKGARPGMIVANTIRVTAKVQLVDMQNRTVTLTGPSFRSRAFKVGPNVDLRGLKPGDDVVVRYTEAVVLNVGKPTR